ncbi:MAG: FAD-dependent oxidoreductase [Blautia marasmi]
MKVLIIGGVAAGTKVAAKLKRESRETEVLILTKSEDISYAGCGLPYYVGDVIHERSQLIVNTPQKFTKLTGADVETGIEVTALDREGKKVTAKVLKSGETKEYTYDKLVIATGASPVVPPLPGLDMNNVFMMRTPDDAEALRKAAESGTIKRAVIAGGGFIGLEVAENLQSRGIRTTVLDMLPHIMPGFDQEMAEYAENHLADQGIMTLLDTKLEGVEGNGTVEKVKTSRRAIKADALVLSLGIRANTAFLADTGIELAPNSKILVDDHMRTNDEDIYALGDCSMITNRMTHQRAWSPMGSSANIEGRIAAQNIAGGDVSYPGVLGTGVVKLPGLNAGRTGLTEQAAKDAGHDVVSVVAVVDDKAHYYPGADSFLVKMITDRQNSGIQVLGKGAVDKMVDIAVVALSMKATVHQLEHLDFAYAPPFSTAIHPFAHCINILLNKMSGSFETFTPVEFAEGMAEGYKVIDASLKPTWKVWNL